MDKFEEYKFFAESTQYLSERRQNATQTYLTVNTAIFAVVALMIKDVGLRGWPLLQASLPLFLVGILACGIWSKIIKQYKALIGWRYNQLMTMEDGITSSYKMYKKEWEDFFKPIQKKERFGFSRLELWLPRLFLGLYFIYAILLSAAVNLDLV